MSIRTMWEKWVYSIASPIGVENRQHTAKEVREAIDTVAFIGTSRGLSAGIGAGLVLGISLPVFLWIAYQPSLDPKLVLEENELRQLRAENKKLRNLASVQKPPLDGGEVKQLRTENEKTRTGNGTLKSLALAPMSSVERNEPERLQSENQRSGIQNERLKIGGPAKPIEGRKEVMARPRAMRAHPGAAPARKAPPTSPPAQVRIAADSRADGRSSDR
jgi:hypothetical protein